MSRADEVVAKVVPDTPPSLNRSRSASIGRDREHSSKGQIEHHDVRLFPCPIENDFATVHRYVEVADEQLASEIGELPLATGLEIDTPELLMRDVSFMITSASSPPERPDAWRPESESGSARRGARRPPSPPSRKRSCPRPRPNKRETVRSETTPDRPILFGEQNRRPTAYRDLEQVGFAIPIGRDR